MKIDILVSKFKEIRIVDVLIILALGTSLCVQYSELWLGQSEGLPGTYLLPVRDNPRILSPGTEIYGFRVWLKSLDLRTSR